MKKLLVSFAVMISVSAVAQESEPTIVRNQRQLDEPPTQALEAIGRNINRLLLPACADQAKPYIGARITATRGTVETGKRWAWAVFQIDPNGALHNADVKAGDLLQSIDGEEVFQTDSVSEMPFLDKLENASKSAKAIDVKFTSRSGQVKVVRVTPGRDCGVSFASTDYVNRYLVTRSSVYYPKALVAAENHQFWPSLVSFEVALVALARENSQTMDPLTTFNLGQAILGRAGVRDTRNPLDVLTHANAFDQRSLSKADALALVGLYLGGYSLKTYKPALKTANQIICGSFCLTNASQGNFALTEDRQMNIERYLQLIEAKSWKALVDHAKFRNPMAILSLLESGPGQSIASPNLDGAGTDSEASKVSTDVPLGLPAKARAAYTEWLLKDNPKAFVLAADGHYGWASGPKNALRGSDKHPYQRAMKNCQNSSSTQCKYYAVDNELVLDR